MTATEIVRLKITLDDVEPSVQRRVEVPLPIRLDRLHAVLQVTLGWTNGHLWEVRAGDTSWGIPDKDWRDVGGPPGYKEFLAAIRDPGHQRHAEFTEWYDADFDPEVVDTEGIKQALAALARRWWRPRESARDPDRSSQRMLTRRLQSPLQMGQGVRRSSG
jgi:hypothetical protein